MYREEVKPMEGLYIRTAAAGNRDDGKKELKLLAKHGELEIMQQRINKRSAAWLCPSDKKDAFEFYLLLSGRIELSADKHETVELGPGDSFSISGLQESVMMTCLETAEVLCVTNTPAFNEVTYWRETWTEQLQRIDEKDHYTLQHSYAVMYYAVHLFEELKEYCGDFDLNDFVVSALFHDIGKCAIPLEILCKPGRLTQEEYDIIKHHASESYRLLKPIYGERMAAMAGMHHERLDGTGYPNGLSGKEIPFEVRILMVADAFDAMTRKRVYRNPVSMQEAAEELCSLPEQYDAVVSQKLLELIKEKKLELYKNVMPATK